MKKKLKLLTAKGLQALAKDVQLKGYTSMKRPALETALSKDEKAKEADLSKYEHYAPKEDKSKATKANKAKSAARVPVSRRRSVGGTGFGRR